MSSYDVMMILACDNEKETQNHKKIGLAKSYLERKKSWRLAGGEKLNLANSASIHRWTPLDNEKKKDSGAPKS